MEVFGCLNKLFMWKGKSAIQIRVQEKMVCSLAVMSISSFASAMLNSRLFIKLRIFSFNVLGMCL